MKKVCFCLHHQNLSISHLYIPLVQDVIPSYISPQVIPKPTRRSKQWICTSQPECKWNTMESLNSCPEYYTNNLNNPVYFEEACRHLPKDAIVIEIAPHGLLQPILRRSLSQHVTSIPLTNRRSADSINFLFTALGR